MYFVDTTGKACPSGVGLPEPGAALPTIPIAYDPSALQTKGVSPYNMCILKGFPTALKIGHRRFPFGLWFANSRTLYVADEGNGDNTYSAATGTYTTAAGADHGRAAEVGARATAAWTLAYTLSSGLSLGTPYTVPGYPTGDNAATGLPWAPATDGLRNITGRVNRERHGHDLGRHLDRQRRRGPGRRPEQGGRHHRQPRGADAARRRASATFESARSGEVLRGVSFTPGTPEGGR